MRIDLRAPAPVPPARVDFSEADCEWIAERIKEVLRTGRLTLGPYGGTFEERFAGFVGAKHAIAISNGTAALEIILRSLGVAGRDVLLPANTFFATAAAVINAGARPVLMDTDLRTLSTAAAEVERRLTVDTAAVVVVHIGGFVTADMPAIVDLLAHKGVWLVEDAAHAHGSLLNDRHAGTFGIAGSFSFYPTKVMTSGEGGMIVTDDDHIAQEARLYRDQGKASFNENSHIRIGNNWRLSEPHAIIGLRHLDNLAVMLRSRRSLGDRYTQALSRRDLGLEPLAVPSGCLPNYYKYIVRLRDGVDRPALKQWLRSEHQVSLSGEVYEIPLQCSPVFHGLDTGDLGDSLVACARHLCLPIFASMTELDLERVVASLDGARIAGRL